MDDFYHLISLIHEKLMKNDNDPNELVFCTNCLSINITSESPRVLVEVKLDFNLVTFGALVTAS